MIRRSQRIVVFGMLGLALGAVGELEAQRHARVQVSWEWGEPGHRARFDHAYRTARLPRVGAPAAAFLYQPVGGVWIPPGHRPRRGYCRLWYPGVAPGHQPRARRCDRLRGLYRPGVLIVSWQGALRPTWDPYTWSYWAGAGDLGTYGAYGSYDAYPAGYAFDGRAWWDVPVRHRARPLPRVRVPRVAYRGAGGRREVEVDRKGRHHPEVREGRGGRAKREDRGRRDRDQRDRRDRGRRGTR